MARDAALPERDPKKAKLAFVAGQRAAKEEDWQTAVESFTEAVKLQPDKVEYKVQWTLAVGKLVRQHIDHAERDAASGHMDDARSELQSAIILDPFNSIVRERLSQMNLPTTARKKFTWSRSWDRRTWICEATPRQPTPRSRSDSGCRWRLIPSWLLGRFASRRMGWISPQPWIFSANRPARFGVR
jgi:hypothetical protein